MFWNAEAELEQNLIRITSPAAKPVKHLMKSWSRNNNNGLVWLEECQYSPTVHNLASIQYVWCNWCPETDYGLQQQLFTSHTVQQHFQSRGTPWHTEASRLLDHSCFRVYRQFDPLPFPLRPKESALQEALHSCYFRPWTHRCNNSYIPVPVPGVHIRYHHSWTKRHDCTMAILPGALWSHGPLYDWSGVYESLCHSHIRTLVRCS